MAAALPDEGKRVFRTTSAESARNVSETDSDNGNVFDNVFGSIKTAVFGSDAIDSAAQDKNRGDGDVGAGHVGRYISLANPDSVSKMMCHVPSVLVFGTLGLLITLAFTWTTGMFIIIAILTLNQFLWGLQMGVLTLIGRGRLRKAVEENWTKKWQDFLKKNPNADEGMLHIVVLPNYKEDEEMLGQTVDNLAGANMAGKYMVVVLGMEQREGPGAKEKADRLIARHKHRFHDMFATYHPPDIPGEIAGKSSNTQWSFREVQRWYGNFVSRNHEIEHDISKVFLTVADADSLHHQDYFTNMALQGLKMSQGERSWTIWQPPVLLSRNFEKVPGPVRISACATLCFEVAGLVSSSFQDHCCFSAYSITLACANHPIVDGWDADVIAEDHHMYMKCMMASYWEEIFSSRKVEKISRMQLKPVWLPVTSYLVEDPSGDYWASCYARFQQARRHSQGVAELSYILLQWASVWMETQGQMPLRAHMQMAYLAGKYCTVHVWNTVTALCYLAVTMISSFTVLAGLIDGSLMARALAVYNMDASEEDREMIFYQLCTFPLFLTSGFFMITGCYLIFRDSLEGRYCPLHLMTHIDESKVNKDFQPFTFKEKISFGVKLIFELMTLTIPGLVFYGCIPLMMAAISLSTVGHKFDYIVAAKPEGANGSRSSETEKPVTGKKLYDYKPVERNDLEAGMDDIELEDGVSSTAAPSSKRNSLGSVGTVSVPVSSIGNPRGESVPVVAGGSSEAQV